MPLSETNGLEPPGTGARPGKTGETKESPKPKRRPQTRTRGLEGLLRYFSVRVEGEGAEEEAPAPAAPASLPRRDPERAVAWDTRALKRAEMYIYIYIYVYIYIHTSIYIFCWGGVYICVYICV